MTVKELLEALAKAKNYDAEVRVIDKRGNLDFEIFTVDQDPDGVIPIVNIIVEDEAEL